MNSLIETTLIPALLPVIILGIYIYRVDNDKEPFGKLLQIFLLGALSTIVAGMVESFLAGWIESFYPAGTLGNLVITNYLGVALVEEFVKWAVIYRYVWSSRYFDDKFDGIVYAAMTSLGFAALENIMYIFSFGPGISLSRAVFAIPGHLAFSVFMGYWFSKAKWAALRGRGGRSVTDRFLSILIPTLVHGTYDFILSMPDSALMSERFLIFVIFIDILTLVLIHRADKRDGSFYGEER
ncbi:MAG: PrsW family glutamic-type intramembrane protease [Eubacteriaceae bacterium]|jgi:RsiW-degrading membrane proteinase PrsW (M82 family)|nr:PrsW family glutamic-type intramembrane protease [Eubacteriaceae bacterium]MDD4507664.1 PrsW family glutamic-type intramembrane protease [Eubacteriaceae bacterium]